MKTTEALRKEAEDLVEYEKELTIKEVLKEHIRRIEETEAEITASIERHEEAKKKYEEILKNRNLLLKICLQKAASQPNKPKE